MAGFDANKAAEALLGDAVFANVMMLGAAWQKGLVPVSEAALKQAIELNGVAIEKNARAFDLGRVMAVDATRVLPQEPEVDDSLEAVIALRVDFLKDYQDEAYALRFADTIAAFRASLPPEHEEELTREAAKTLFRLMAIKDEYEVARLHSQTGFDDILKAEFEDGFKKVYHMAPPLLSRKKDARGRPMKRSFGPWMSPVMARLAGLKTLRGSKLDLFGYTAERRMERGLRDWFMAGLAEITGKVFEDNLDETRRFLTLPQEFRGYGPVKEASVKALKPTAEKALQAVRAS